METNVNMCVLMVFAEVWNQRQIKIQELIGAGGVTHSEEGDFSDHEQFMEHVYQPTIAAFPDLDVPHVRKTQSSRTIALWCAGELKEPTREGFGIPATESPRLVSWHDAHSFRERQEPVEGYDSWNQIGLLHVLESARSIGSVKLIRGSSIC